MKCKICQQHSKRIFSARILKKYKVVYFYCNSCGFLFTEEPFWLEEVYKEPISKFDTGIINRNIMVRRKLSILLFHLFNKKGVFVDFAAGYGLLVRMMRDIGFDFYWSDKYSANLFSRGFEWYPESSAVVEAVTAVECFEHLPNPRETLEEMLRISRNIIFTTELLPCPVPGPDEWWYYTLERGGHVSFYSPLTLNFLAGEYGLRYYSVGPFHVFTDKLTCQNIKENLVRYLMSSNINSVLLKKSMKSKTWDDFQYFRSQD